MKNILCFKREASHSLQHWFQIIHEFKSKEALLAQQVTQRTTTDLFVALFLQQCSNHELTLLDITRKRAVSYTWQDILKRFASRASELADARSRSLSAKQLNRMHSHTLTPWTPPTQATRQNATTAQSRPTRSHTTNDTASTPAPTQTRRSTSSPTDTQRSTHSTTSRSRSSTPRAFFCWTCNCDHIRNQHTVSGSKTELWDLAKKNMREASLDKVLTFIRNKDFEPSTLYDAVLPYLSRYEKIMTKSPTDPYICMSCGRSGCPDKPCKTGNRRLMAIAKSAPLQQILALRDQTFKLGTADLCYITRSSSRYSHRSRTRPYHLWHQDGSGDSGHGSFTLCRSPLITHQTHSSTGSSSAPASRTRRRESGAVPLFQSWNSGDRTSTRLPTSRSILECSRASDPTAQRATPDQ